MWDEIFVVASIFFFTIRLVFGGAVNIVPSLYIINYGMRYNMRVMEFFGCLRVDSFVLRQWWLYGPGTKRSIVVGLVTIKKR